MKVYTLTTDDEEGTKTKVFNSLEDRDKTAFQWILSQLTQWGEDHAPFIGLPINEAYELFEDTINHGESFMWYDTHDIDPQEADLSPVGSETADLQGNTPETADAALQRLVEGLENMIEGERLQEADIPDDCQWLIHMIESALRLL